MVWQRLATWRWPTLVVGLTLLATGWLAQHERELQVRDQRRSFDFAVRQAANRIEQRMASYEQMLRGVRGLFDASDEVTVRDFERYVNLLVSGADFVGLRAIGHAPLAADGTARVRVTAPAGSVLPGGSGSDGNLLAWPVLQAAMLQARDGDRAVVTSLVRHEAGPPGDAVVVLFMPLYKSGRPLSSVADRREQVDGWVFAVFRVGEMVASVYGDETPGLDLRLHDGVGLDDSNRIHPASRLPDPPSPRFDSQEYLAVAGHTWTLWMRSLPGFDQPPGQDPARLVALGGAGLAGALGLVTWLLVTGRDRAQQTARGMTRQLHASERQYRRIVETASEGIWVLDARGHTLFANPALQRLLGSGSAPLAGRPCTDFMDAAGHAMLLGATQGSGPGLCDLPLRRSDGSTLWARVSVSPITDADGQPAGLLAMVTDDSQRHADEARRALLEDQLRQSQKMEAIGTLAGGIAHDFTNILGAILGNLALVQQDLGSGHPVQPRLAQVAQAGARARSLVQQIVTFSRQQPQALQVQPLAPLVEESARLLRATLPARVDLVLHIQPDTPPVAVDATQLQQVLLNLCTNAWHALSDDKGRIEIGLATRQLDAGTAERLAGPPPGMAVHLWVRDNGCGMDEATRQRIFEPFFTTKPVGQGTGLGLSVVHGIVASHGGAMEVDSAPGAGSTFHVVLPCATDAVGEAAPSPVAALPVMGRGQHVLYVDDDAVMGLMVETLLQRQGWRVSVCDDAAQALARALHGDDPVDLVVSDFNMPGQSGLDLARALGAARPALPVVITSGYITDALRAEAAQLGVRHVLQKEHTLDQLGPVVAQVLAATAATAEVGSVARPGVPVLPPV